MIQPLYSYVVIFEGVTVLEFAQIIDSYNAEILNWYSVLPQTVFVVSGLTASDLTKFIRNKVTGISRLLVLNAKTARNGWLPKAAWDFLNNPRPVKPPQS